jgi:hypothetical protein
MSHTLAKVFAIALVCAAAPPAAFAQGGNANAHRECFLKSNVDSFSAPNDRTLYVSVGVREIWRLDLMHDCTGLTFKQGIGFQTTPGFPWVCSPLDATVIVRDAGITQRCPVTAMHHLTPAERDALPKRDRP